MNGTEETGASDDHVPRSEPDGGMTDEQFEAIKQLAASQLGDTSRTRVSGGLLEIFEAFEAQARRGPGSRGAAAQYQKRLQQLRTNFEATKK